MIDDLVDWQSPVEGSLDRVTFPDGKLDEICGRYVHLEHMGGGSWFLLVGHDDGTETAVWFKSKDLRRPIYERRPPRTLCAQLQQHQPASTENKAAV